MKKQIKENAKDSNLFGGENIIFLIFSNVTYTPDRCINLQKKISVLKKPKKIQSKFIGITKITAYFVNSL